MDWHSGNLGAWGIDCAAKALKRSSVTELDLRYNHIGAGVSVIAEALKVNTQLTKLELAGNHLGDQGTADVAMALKRHSALTRLGLQINDIKDAGAVALADLLRVNTKIGSVSVEANNIGERGQAALELSLRSNTSLLEYTGPGGLPTMAQRQENRRLLNRIDFSHQHLSDADICFIVHFIRHLKLVPEADRQNSVVVVQTLSDFFQESRTIAMLNLHGSTPLCWFVVFSVCD